MARYYGKIGYSTMAESKPGVFVSQDVEYEYSGDVLKLSSRNQTTNQVNDNINIQHKISILADPFANSHFSEMKYIEYMGVKWHVTDVEVQYPRLIISAGGVYNG